MTKVDGGGPNAITVFLVLASAFLSPLSTPRTPRLRPVRPALELSPTIE
jgi:hypothetical protein